MKLRGCIFLSFLLLLQGCSGIFEREPKILQVSGATECGPFDTAATLLVECDLRWQVTLQEGDWVTIEAPAKLKANGNAQLKLGFSHNRSDSERSAVLLIKAGRGTERVTVTQKGMKGFFSQEEFVLRQTAPSLLEFYSPGLWSVGLAEDSDWISLSGRLSGGAGAVSVVVAANDPNENVGSRSGGISVTVCGDSFVLPVMQPQTDALLLDVDAVQINFRAGEFSVPVRSNIEFDIAPSADWIRHLPATRALNESVETFAVDENPDTQSRSASVLFTSKADPSLQAVLTVEQKGGDPILRQTIPGLYGIDDGTIMLGYDGWTMSSRVKKVNGSFEYRLLNSSILTVYKVGGVNPAAEPGTSCTVQIVRQTQDEQSFLGTYAATVLERAEGLIWLKVSDDTYFIVQQL